MRGYRGFPRSFVVALCLVACGGRVGDRDRGQGGDGRPTPPDPPAAPTSMDDTNDFPVAECEGASVWEPPTNLFPASGHVHAIQTDLLVDAAGTARVGWTSISGNAGFFVADASLDADRWRVTKVLECDSCWHSFSFDPAGGGAVVASRPNHDSTFLARHFDAAAGWGPVSMPTGERVGLESPCGVGASGGRAVFVWRPEENGSAIQSTEMRVGRQASAGGPWTDEQLTATGAGGLFCSSAVTARGRDLVVLSQADGLYAHSFGGNRWVARRITEAGARTADPRIGTDATGGVLLVWHELSPADFSSALWWSRFEPRTSTWTTPRMAARAGAGQGIWWLSLAVNDAGDAVAVWSEAPEFEGPGSVVRGVRMMAGTEWGMAADLFDGKKPDVGIDAAGNAYAIADDDDEALVRVSDGPRGAWGPIEVANPPKVTSVSGYVQSRPQDVRIAVSPSGDAVAVWSSQGMWVSRRVCPK